VFASVRPFVYQRDYAKSFKEILMKLCRIMDYCYWKNPFNFGVYPTQSGRLAAIFNFCYNACMHSNVSKKSRVLDHLTGHATLLCCCWFMH